MRRTRLVEEQASSPKRNCGLQYYERTSEHNDLFHFNVKSNRPEVPNDKYWEGNNSRS